jgi:hypothetical protein
MAQKQCKCRVCGETFDSELALERHYRTTHSQCKCEICGRTFQSESELEIHNRIAHPEEALVS